MSESPITTCSVQPRESIELPIVKETEQKNKEYGDEEVDIEEDSKHDEGDNDVGQDTISDHNVFTIFFWNEVNKFQEERKKDFWKDMTREDIGLDFTKLFDEWRTFGRDWRLQTEVKEGEMCSELVVRILMGFLFTVLPNCMIVLDYTAAYQYLNGTDYPKLDSNLQENSCEKFTFTSLYWQFTNQVLRFSPTIYVLLHKRSHLRCPDTNFDIHCWILLVLQYSSQILDLLTRDSAREIQEKKNVSPLPTNSLAHPG